MSIWRDVVGADRAALSTHSVVTIGNFDGVHRGHCALIAAARAQAEHAALPLVVVTFDPHPVAVFAADREPARLTSAVDRVALLRGAGADHVFVLAFDRRMAAWSPAEFIDRVLVDQLRAARVLVGENFRFGAKAAGDVTLLEAEGREKGFSVTGFELVGDGPAWSSTSVREAVAAGDVERATEILGRPHAVCGVVVRGDQRGRDLGFPTANLPVEPHVAVPADGVYAGWLSWEGQERLPAAISVGTNPTFGGLERRVESYVLDRDDLDLYGRRVTVEFVARVRGQVEFGGADALVGQMNADIDETRRLLHL